MKIAQINRHLGFMRVGKRLALALDEQWRSIDLSRKRRLHETFNGIGHARNKGQGQIDVADNMPFVKLTIIKLDLPSDKLNIVKGEGRRWIIALWLGHELVKQVREVVTIIGLANDPEFWILQTNFTEHRSAPDYRGQFQVHEEAIETDEVLVPFPFPDSNAHKLDGHRVRVDADTFNRNRSVQCLAQLIKQDRFDHRWQHKKTKHAEQHKRKENSQTVSLCFWRLHDCSEFRFVNHVIQP